MYEFNVPDMTCGHCVGTVTRAIKASDPAASVEADVSRHLVRVQSAKLSQEEIQQQIAKAGYSPSLT
jgi:copper chaperone